MTTKLPQKYQEVARALVPYQNRARKGQMALIGIEPPLPCTLCGHPASEAIIAPALDQAPGAWLTFPLCGSCVERQVKAQGPHDE
ncbi:MAG: hypothetical protein Kow0031_14950 [Anaerolineae bacterium]